MNGAPGLDPAILKLAVDSSFDAVLVLDATSFDEAGLPRIAFANGGVERQTGYKPDEIVGKSTAVFYGPKTDPATVATLQHISKTLEPVSVEMVNYRKDGTAFWVETSTRPVTNAAGQVTHWITIRRDVTRRKFIEDTLRGSEERYRLLFDSNPNPMWVFDRATLAFLAVNEAAVQHYGYARQEFLSMTLADIRPVEDRERFVEMMRTRTSLARNEHTRHRKRDGTVFDVEITAQEINWMGHQAQLILAVDVSGRIAAQRELLDASNRLQTTVAQMPAIVFTTDKDLRITWHDGAALAALGLAPNQLVGVPVLDFMLSRDPNETLPKEFERALAGQASTFERTFVDRQYHTHIEPYRNERGEIIGTMGVAIDVTESRDADRKIKESEERLRIVSEATTDLVWDWDLANDRVVWNEAIKSIFGYSDAELHTGPTWWTERLHPSDRGRVLSDLRTAVDGRGQAWTDEYRFQRRDGSYAEVIDHGFIIRDAAGKAVRMIGSMQDVTERRLAEVALRESEARFAAAQRVARLGSFELDLASDSIVASPVMREIYGLNGDVKDAPTLRSLVHPDDRANLTEILNGARAAGGRVQTDYRVVRPDASVRWVHLIGEYRGSGDPNDGKFVGTVMDITERKEAEERALHLTNFDPVTDLPNRLLLEDRLGQALVYARRASRSAAVLAIEINRFDHVGRTIGRLAADELLKSIAARFGEAIRAGDTLAHIASGTFIVALADMARSEDAVIAARKLLDCLSFAFRAGDNEVFVSASIGISLYPHDAMEPRELIRKAESALAEAQLRGEGGFRFFTPAKHESALERVALETALRRAIDRTEFELHYQPIIDVQDRSMVAAEALVRWPHPTKGLLPPAEFIPVAEETGLIVPLGELVVKHACRQLAQWRRDGFRHLRVAVNVSSRQFAHEGFVKSIERALAESGVPPQFLELEITESAVVKDVEGARKVFAELKALGVRLAIDDFGIGYSALGYLKHFPFDTLKIDRAFISDITSDPFDEAIAASVAALGRSLGLNVTAEGIETESQLSVVRGLHCHEAQGFLFSKAVPAEEFGRRLQAQRTA